MALNIKDPVTERLAAQVAELAHENKTQSIRIALQERKQRLELQRGYGQRRANLLRRLESDVWPLVPPEVLGKPISKAEEERILGIGPEGV